MNTELILNLALIVAGVTAIAAGMVIADRRMHRKMRDEERKETERLLGGPFVD